MKLIYLKFIRLELIHLKMINLKLIHLKGKCYREERSSETADIFETDAGVSGQDIALSSCFFGPFLGAELFAETVSVGREEGWGEARDYCR